MIHYQQVHLKTDTGLNSHWTEYTCISLSISQVGLYERKGSYSLPICDWKKWMLVNTDCANKKEQV